MGLHRDIYGHRGQLSGRDARHRGGQRGPEEEVSPVWVYVEPEATLDLEEIESNLCAYSGPNAYVDSNIEQECIEEGCGYENNPFKTITWTTSIIRLAATPKCLRRIDILHDFHNGNYVASKPQINLVRLN